MLKHLWAILKNEDGGLPLIAGLLMGGSTILGATAGKNKEKTIDPYSALRGDWQTWLRSKLGTSTPYSYNEDFTTQQPEVESALQSTILGGLNKGSGLKTNIMDTMNKYQQSRVASLEGQKEKDLRDTGDMYNRLGLVSSSPGLAAQDEVRSDYGLKLNELNADVAREGIGYEMDATKLSEDIINQYMGQAQVLGGQQRGYQQESMKMSMADIERMVNEETGYGQQAAGVLGSNPPETYFEPNIWSKIAKGGQDIGSMMLLSQILGGNKLSTAGTTKVGSVPKYQSIIGSQR